MYENNKHMGIALEVDSKSHIIIDAEVIVITDLVKNYFRKLLIGHNLTEDITPLIEEIKKGYLVPSQTSMIILRDSGMAQSVSNLFVSFANQRTLPLFSFWSAGLVNFFIPSGGGQWAIQGPIMLEAANELGSSMEAVITAIAWGDSWTNQLQPFWALPLLAIAGLDIRDIMGYTTMIFFVSGIIISGFMLFM